MKKKEIKSIDDLYRNPILFDITIIACMSVLVAFLIKEFGVKERIDERENTKKD